MNSLKKQLELVNALRPHAERVRERLLQPCAERECAPPFGDKDDCEFYDKGWCNGATDEEIKELLNGLEDDEN